MTSSPRLAATALVTAEEAIIEPFGITVQPCRLDCASKGALAGIDAPCLVRVVAEENQEPRESTAEMEEVRQRCGHLPS